MHTTHLENSPHCPNCLYKLDAASHEENVQPQPGDLSICLQCGAPLVFKEDMNLRLLRPEEIDGLTPDLLLKLWQMQMAVHFSWHGRRSGAAKQLMRSNDGGKHVNN